MTAPERPAATVEAWDLPTRLFHWALVLAVVSAWISYEYAEALDDVTLIWHRANGLAVLVLLVWRILWGVWGPRTARFASFVRGPAAIWSYARQMLAGRAARYLGHNPLGAIMVLALLAVLILQAGFGLFATDDNDLVGGPLYRLVGDASNARAAGWHAWIFDVVLLPLALLHIAVNIAYTLLKKEPLIPAMITGDKPAASYADGVCTREKIERPLLRAFALLLVAAGIVFGGILAAGGRLALW